MADFLFHAGLSPNGAAFWLLLAALITVALIFLTERRATRRAQLLRRQLEETRIDLSAAEVRIEALPALEEKLTALSNEKAALESHVSAQDVRLEERERALRELRERMDTDFRAATSTMLDEARKTFLEQANQSFSQHREAASLEMDKRRKAMDELLRPVSDTLHRYEKGLTAFRDEHQKSRGELASQIGELSKTTQTVRMEAKNLATALRKGPKTRGRWGEEQLRNVVEMAGMASHVDFVEQVTTHDEEGRRKQPDMVVRLPGERFIAVDSKVSLSAYLDAVEAETDAERSACLARHGGDLWAHVKSLASKDYAASLKDSLDYVVMFVPGENYYAAALEARPQLYQDAFERKVLIATPTILIAVLKSAAHYWRQEKLTEHAQTVAGLAADLYDSLRTLSGNMAGIGRALNSAVNSYNSAIGGYEGRVLSRARKFAEYEIPGVEKTIEPIKAIETAPRNLREDTQSRVDQDNPFLPLSGGGKDDGDHANKDTDAA